MPIPIAQIISTAAPLVMSAVELYRRRNDAKTGAPGAGGASESLQRRMRELEEADLEQSRLIAELSRSLEAMARMMESAQAENRHKEEKIRQLLWAVGALAVVSVGLAVWALAR